MARGINCSSNQRQLLEYHHLYANDYNDWAIGTYYNANRGYANFVMMYSRNNGIGLAKWEYGDSSERGQGRLLKCSRPFDLKQNSDTSFTTYVICNNLSTSGVDSAPYKRPGDWIWDNVYGFFKIGSVMAPSVLHYQNCAKNYAENYFRYWHNNRTIIGWVDGHVEGKHWNDFNGYDHAYATGIGEFFRSAHDRSYYPCNMQNSKLKR